ncbi:MAG: zinc dependent phospholipase C family protein, partial [Longimicrobiales bacterium]|nr:zinc dependent phospholipase C family protein [Longimicrobiales bacterium]
MNPLSRPALKPLAAVAGAVALLLLTPDRLLAFGPATHVFLGEQLLSSLYLLPAAIADLLRAYPLSFLYGSVAADISFAKKYVPAGRHSHYWHVGEEILDAARNDRLRAAGYGYLCHLAADTIAHNFFVPRQLMLTSSTKSLGHSYWEHRLDVELGEGYTGRAREVVMDYDHSEADNLFDTVLSGTLFSFETNRRIFRGMVRIQDNERWQNVFGRMLDRSRWDLHSDDAVDYLATSFDSMVDYLLRRRASVAAARDPIGDFNLHLSK